MQRHNSYPYSFGVTAPSRYAHGTSSAQSPSANPDEDWTKISDLAERRRIQNRIAQRNYRKKLKRRLEDLERRAGSSSASPEQKPAEMVPSQVNGVRKDDLKKRRSLTKPVVTPNKSAGRSPVPPTAPTFNGRDDGGMFSKQYQRQLSASPPPTLTYSYGPSDGIPAPLPPPYPQHGAPYHTLPAPYPDYQSPHSVYLPPLPMSRAGYGSYDSGAASKPEGHYTEDDLMNNFSFSYASVHGIDAPAATTQSFEHSYAPAVSDSFGPFGHSRTASPASQPLSAFAPPQGNLGVPQHPVLGF